MAIEGKGPYEIARILATEKVERPSYYLAQRGMGNHQSNYNAADPYTWRGGTVADILSKQEYMGHTVNFRTYKESYKDKRVKMTPKEDLVIFENTQEAIIDKETWERVQTLRKTIRRTDSIGKANPLTGFGSFLVDNPMVFVVGVFLVTVDTVVACVLAGHTSCP